MDLGRSARDRRIAEIAEELRPLHVRIQELAQERCRLLTANAREDWPEGPFTLHYMQHYSEETDEYDTPLEALRAADGIEDYGSGSTTKITDRSGRTIYDLSSYPWKLLEEGYPEVPR